MTEKGDKGINTKQMMSKTMSMIFGKLENLDMYIMFLRHKYVVYLRDYSIVKA